MPRMISSDELAARGLTAARAAELAPRVSSALAREPVEAWREISQRILRPEDPFAVHRWLFDTTFADWDARRGPAPAWSPTPVAIESTNVARLMRRLGLTSIAELHAWSIREPEAFVGTMVEELGLRFERPPTRILDLSAGVENPGWLPGARLNIADSCFLAPQDKTAIVYHDEAGKVARLTYGELESLVNRVSAGLARAGFRPGDALAIYMPMTVEAVAAYLGIVRAGCVVVCVADSLAPAEIAVRLRLGGAKGVVTQDVLVRGGKPIPLHAKVVEAGAERAIVVPAGERPTLRAGDLAWDEFLAAGGQFSPHIADPDEMTTVLFSSGTTGEPKAIPWTHVSPIRSVIDAALHQNVQPDDVVAWPTNLGWVMGSWLVYASLVNRATMALFGGAPTGRDFGQFVEAAQVTMLGVIPSLVKTWRASDCMRGLDWSAVRRFSTTGECSNVDDMLWLMSRAGYKPVIEYCGGTELGGGYISATMAQPNAPSTFSTPDFGSEIVLLDEHGAEADAGEVFLVPPSIGMSTRLLHHDHHAVYYEGTPRGPRGQLLRRHGDSMERLAGGYYRVTGRVDDTMNLGGIKVSSVEIERVLNTVPGVRETAAVAVSPPGGGPSLLWVFAVLSDERLGGDVTGLTASLQDAIRKHLSPLFKIQTTVVIDALPRTASNKVMRRLLRDQAHREVGAMRGAGKS